MHASLFLLIALPLFIIANKSLGDSSAEQKKKKALAEAAAVGVKTAESQLVVAKTKAKKANGCKNSVGLLIAAFNSYPIFI